MNPIDDYVRALKDSDRLGPQTAHHRYIPGTVAQHRNPRRPWPAGLAAALAARETPRLYTHQAEAVDRVRAGRNVVLSTPTSSGKTLAYNLPVLESCLADPETRALYLFPLKALAQDQLAGFDRLAALIPEENLPLEPSADPGPDEDAPSLDAEPPQPKRIRPRAAIYDGDTTPHFRRKIRNDPPNALLTNPEMVHLSILPHHHLWASFLAGLTHVVVDEVHTYRGVMGAHMAQVFRRLSRMCRYYGSSPVFIFCSATVGNPAQLCTQLTGLDVEAVTESGAASSGRHMVFVNPLEGAARASIQLLQSALARGLRTIIYTQSRKLTELISIWAQERSGEYRDRISAYRAGFLPEERREIEAKLSSGELLAVISTSALELGIDIGGLDLCILAGYPGTVMQTLQRGGRVGRGGRDSCVVLVAQEDALDQYFMRNPDDFFSRPPEDAVVNPANPVIASRHLVCAAAELPLVRNEEWINTPEMRPLIETLLARGEILQSADGREYHPLRKAPQREVDLRGAGRSLVIEDPEGTPIGSVDLHRSFKETHPGAVYLHRGRTFVVDELDTGAGAVRARPARVGYYTRVRSEKSTDVLEVKSVLDTGPCRAFFARLRITEQVTGYEKRAVRGGKLLTVVPLDLPPLVFETEGLWFEVPLAAQRRLQEEYFHFMGAIHALEHAAIGILPLLVLADRNDLGGISTPMHPQTGGPAVFIYDGIPGGAGLTRQAHPRAGELLRTTLETVKACACDMGCPSCVHSPKCGSGNRPMDKAGALFLLEMMTGNAVAAKPTSADPSEFAPPPAAPENGVDPADPKAQSRGMARKPRSPQSSEAPSVVLPGKPPADFAVLDIETRHSAQDVGGWGRADRMGVSVACVWDSASGEFHDFPQNEVDEMFAHLKRFDLIIGFNIVRFDYKVLSGLSAYPFHKLPTLDLLVHVHQRLGYRLKLDNLAQATLGAGKTADGLMALRWWKQGRLDLITEYCRADVAATRDLYLHGRDKGHVLFSDKSGAAVRLDVVW